MAENKLPEVKEDNFLNMIIFLLNQRLNKNELDKKFDAGKEGSLLIFFKIKEQAPEAYNELAAICGIRGIVGDNIIWGWHDPRCATNADFFRTAIKSYINSTPDRAHAAGRFLWHTLKRVNIDSDKHKNLSAEKFFQECARFDKDKISILGGIGSFLNTKDKIFGIDWVITSHKSDGSGVYTSFVRDLANYNIGADASKQKELAEYTLRQLVSILQKSREGNGGKLLKMALPAIENAANNALYLENVIYRDENGTLGPKNKVYALDNSFKQDLYKRLKRSKLEISDNIKDFLEDKGSANQKLQKRIRIANRHFFRYDFDLNMRRKYASKQKDIIEANLFAPSVKSTNDLVEDYATFLTNYVVFSQQDKKDKIEIDKLSLLLKKNADYMDLNTISGSLFDDGIKTKRNINKVLVNKIAAVYASSISCTDEEAEEFSSEFHEKMTDMFISVVKEHNYKKSEVSELCDILAKGAGGAKEFTDMGRRIMKEYTSLYPQNRFTKKR